jgi:hypothetical protein
MKPIYFVTLSLGVNYTKEYTLLLIEDILSKTPHKIIVTTECPDIITEKYPNNDRIILNIFDRSKYKVRLPIGPNKGSSDFNFNLRYLCLEPLLEMEDGVAIFTDCDNSLEWWDEEMVQNSISNYLHQGIDFLAPRTDYKFKFFLEEYKTSETREMGILWHKYYNYDLDINPKPEWDEAPIPAEYMLVFLQLGEKMRKFHKQWKTLHDYLCNKDYTFGTWAEGFEIGVSSLVAGYVPCDIGWHHDIFGRAIRANGHAKGIPTERDGN